MWLRVSCNFKFHIPTPLPFVLMLRPRSGAQQWVAREEYRLNPNVVVVEFTDIYGNLCQRLTAPQGDFTITTNAEVMITDTIDEAFGAPFTDIQSLPDEVLSYLLPSRYCESDRFHLLASEITYGQQAGYNQVAEIVGWLREHIRYSPESTDIPASAVETNIKGYGVCRDFAHLGIALCRSLSIPARMVVGYLYRLQPMDLHAWFEAYVGGRWYTFDAINKEFGGAYVAVGYGRDAADVAIYNQYGPPIYPQAKQVEVTAFTPTEPKLISNRA